MTTTLPTSSVLAESLLRVLSKNPSGLSVREIDNAVIEDLKIDSEAANIIRSGNRTEIQYRLAWCRTKAKKANLIERTDSSTWKIKLR